MDEIHITRYIYAINAGIPFTNKRMIVDDWRILTKTRFKYPPKEIVFNSCIDVSNPDYDITEICNMLFSGCRNLEAIHICNDDTLFKSIDGVLYSKDGTKLLFCPPCKKGTVIIPDGVQSIETSAFEHSKITHIFLPDSLKVIKKSAFWSSKIIEIIFGNNVCGVERNAFRDCHNLTKIQLNEGLTRIGDYAFCGCACKSVELPSSLEYIGMQAFANIEHIKINGTVSLCSVIDSICTYQYNYDDNILSNTIEVINDDYSVFIPRFIKKSRCHDIAIGICNKSNDMYKFATLNACKQDTAISAYIHTNDEQIKNSLKRISKKIIQRLIEGNDIPGYGDKLIEFLRLKVMSQNALVDSLQMAKEHNNATAIAYILQAMEDDSNKNKFTL